MSCQSQRIKSTLKKRANANKKILSGSNKSHDIRQNKNQDKEKGWLYFFLLIMTATFACIMQNRLELHIVIKQIEAEGIDYDAFRDLKISTGTLETIKKNMEVLDEENKETAMLNKETDSGASYLSVSFLISQVNKNYNLTGSNYKYLLNYLSGNTSFKELKEYYYTIIKDIKYFPVAADSKGDSVVTFTDTWNSYRSYGGNRRHEGTDLMAKDNKRGIHKIVSMTDGTVEKMGWLPQGGYRIGIRGTKGAYFYYAHLDSYAQNIKIGDEVKAGDFLGYMGDSGYGTEGTVGKFDVHLHMGIYIDTSFGEISVNPYSLLLYLNTKPLIKDLDQEQE